MSAPETGELCLNCGTPLAGQYCGKCGQRATSRFISLWQLLTDAFGDLFELDSRLWRTLVPLLVRPGQLTRDYLEGRRARYMPPFRMYLVLSLIFFVVAFFDPERNLGIPLEEEPVAEEEAATQAAEDARSAEGEKRAREVLEELVDEGIVDESALRRSGLDEPGPEEAEDTGDEKTPSDGGAEPAASDGFNIQITDEAKINCGSREFSTEGLSPWLQRRLTPDRLDRLCDRWEVAGADGLAQAMLDRVPAGLILLLPVMALVLKLLYLLSGRYYVEHLLFFVHFHAFVFLLLTLQILWARLIGLVGVSEAIAVIPIVATSLYVPAYLFKAMRRVYGQSKFITFLKFLVLTIGYALGFSVMLLGVLFLAAVSV